MQLFVCLLELIVNFVDLIKVLLALVFLSFDVRLLLLEQMLHLSDELLAFFIECNYCFIEGDVDEVDLLVTILTQLFVDLQG